MRRPVATQVIGVLLLLVSGAVFSVQEVTVSDVTAVVAGDTVVMDSLVTFSVRTTNTNSGASVTAYTNSFRMWVYRNGMYTDAFTTMICDTASLGWPDRFDLYYSFHPYSADGIGEDTVRFGGARISGAGFPDGFDEVTYFLSTVPGQEGDTLCLDSSWAPPGAAFIWATTIGTIVPDWGGPYCYTVVCCVENQGNVDLQGGVNVADLSRLVSYIFPPHDSLLCYRTGDVDGQTIFGSRINVADLAYLVDYLFFNGPPPAPCEER